MNRALQVALTATILVVGLSIVPYVTMVGMLFTASAFIVVSIMAYEGYENKPK